MSYWTWAALMMGALSLVLWAVVSVVAIVAWVKLRPMVLAMMGAVQAYGMVGAMMNDAEKAVEPEPYDPDRMH